jgi:hypothetical protein
MLDMAVNRDGVLELLDQTDQKHDEAHKRLRADVQKIEERHDEALGLLRDIAMANKTKILELEKTPIDATKIVMRAPVIVSIVVFVVTIVGGMYASTSGLRSSVDKIMLQMTAASDLSKERAERSADSNTVIKESLANNSRELKEQISLITKRQELQQMQIQAMQESIIRLTPQGRR